MKKLFITLFVVLLSACSLSMGNTPKARVKELLDRYKNQDTSVLSDLEDVIGTEYTGEYKDRYKTLMLNQYKNLEYKITDEVIDGDTAIVTADVTVYDYGRAIDASNTYLREHENEFTSDINNDNENSTTRNEESNAPNEGETTMDDENTQNENTTTNNTTTAFDNDKFLAYRFNLLEEVTDRKTYSIDFTLTKEDNEWVLDDLSNDTISKLHGIYTE